MATNHMLRSTKMILYINSVLRSLENQYTYKRHSYPTTSQHSQKWDGKRNAFLFVWVLACRTVPLQTWGFLFGAPKTGKPQKARTKRLDSVHVGMTESCFGSAAYSIQESALVATKYNGCILLSVSFPSPLYCMMY